MSDMRVEEIGLQTLSPEVSARIDIVLSDITTLVVDAIVNAANSSLLGGGGVDGAIHRAAGPQLVDECRLLGGCKTGEAKITKGYRLAATYIIHTVGPVWRGGAAGEVALLAACYRNSMAQAVANEVRTIAFPAISTGIYGFPIELATRIALATVAAALAEMGDIDKVTFCCFSDRDLAIYQRTLALMMEPEG